MVSNGCLGPRARKPRTVSLAVFDAVSFVQYDAVVLEVEEWTGGLHQVTLPAWVLVPSEFVDFLQLPGIDVEKHLIVAGEATRASLVSPASPCQLECVADPMTYTMRCIRNVSALMAGLCPFL